jgi:hypothetical protein
MPTIRMVNGIQSHTTATAAPTIIDAVGITPMCRAKLGAMSGECGVSTGAAAAGLGVSIATMTST